MFTGAFCMYGGGHFEHSHACRGALHEAAGQRDKMSNEKTSTVGTAAATVVGEDYLTKAEVAVRMRKPIGTIEDWMKGKKIPFYRIERAIRFRWSEVQAYFAGQCRVAAVGEGGEPEAGGRKSGGRDQRPEVRGQKAEVRTAPLQKNRPGGAA